MTGRSADPVARRIEDRLHGLGDALRAAVFEGSADAARIGEALSDAGTRARTRVRIGPGPSIPWEIMLSPGSDEPLALEAASFVRFDPARESAGAAAASSSAAIRVLLAVARPAGEEDVPFRSVASRIVQSLAASPAARIRLDLLRPPTFAALGAVLEEAAARGEPFDVVHFDGHGVYRGSAFAPAKKRGYLRFEGAGDSADLVDGGRIGELLADHGVRLLLLNACRSAYAEPRPAARRGKGEEAPERAFGSLADDVLAAGVPAVLAMAFNVYVVTAAHVLADTYAALAAGRTLGEAVAHARRRRAGAARALVATAFDWMVPVAFESCPAPLLAGSAGIPEISVDTVTVTPAPERFAAPPAFGGEAFVGRDGALLELERGFRESKVVELVGLAGVGKSALAAEFARWVTFTGGLVTGETPGGAAAVVIEVGECRDFAACLEVAARRLDALGETGGTGATGGAGDADGRLRALARASEVLWVLDGVDAALAGADADPWSPADREALRDLIRDLAAGASRVLVTGRAPVGIEGATVLSVPGLDAEARRELARLVADPGLLESLSAAPALEWTRGIPTLVREVGRLAAAGSDVGATRELLHALRSGEPTDTARTLAGRARVEPFRGDLDDPSLPLALYLFQGRLAGLDWESFRGTVARWGLALAATEDGELERALRPAERLGLARPDRDGGYELHPLAPFAFREYFDGMCAQCAGGDRHGFMNVLGRLWGSWCQAVSVGLRMANRFGGKLPAFVGPVESPQNLWRAAELSVRSAWWGLALPLLPILRDELLGERRVEEWESLFGDTLRAIEEHPPREEEMGPENAELHLARLLSAEAERTGDHEAAERLRALAVRAAWEDDTVLEIIDEEE